MTHSLLARVGQATLPRTLAVIGAFTLMSALPPVRRQKRRKRGPSITG